MRIGKQHHLTYCTNIHPGESWTEVLDNLKQYIPAIKKTISPDQPFGIGLRLSELASRELLEGTELNKFKDWLSENNLYVFTLNGFPYGGFHGQRVKDAVHKPDWTTHERVRYTLRLCSILSELLPQGMEGSISTSPISYKPWFLDNVRAKEMAFSIGCDNIIQVIDFLDLLYQTTGTLIHLDLEPEPDGLIENTEEVISFVQKHLLPASTKPEWTNTALRHFRVCYDVCHVAIEYENPEEVFSSLKKAGIKIGKIQISAALQVDLAQDKKLLERELTPFVESTYLHQVIERHADGTLVHYTDLPEALKQLHSTSGVEWRTHFHVPLFVDRYQALQSTQQEIEKVLELIQEQDICAHLEIETYTWEVLPEALKMSLQQSIEREIQWVKDFYEKSQKWASQKNKISHA